MIVCLITAIFVDYKIAMEAISKFNQDIAKEKHSLKNVIQKIAMIYKDILTNYNEH